MATYRMNLFEITNLSALNCHYRLFEVQGLVDSWEENDTLERNLNLLVKQIAYGTKGPVARFRRNNIIYLALPSDHTLSRLEYALTPDVLTLKPLNECHQLVFDDLTPETNQIALTFLMFALRTPLRQNSELWNSGSSNFYTRRSLNWRDDGREIDIYGGFGFRLILLDGKLYLAVRLTYKYVDRHWLIDRCNGRSLNDYRMQHVLYHFGHQWFPVQLLGTTGRSIVEQKFDPDNGEPTTNVYDYTMAKTGSRPPNYITTLDPHSPAINYRYPGNEKRRYGAGGLCKLILATDNPHIKTLHRMSIQPPEQRFSSTRRVVEKYFQSAELSGIPVQINLEPHRVQTNVFMVPDQRFGQDRVLRIGNKSQSDGVPLQNLGRCRLEILSDPDAGALMTSSFDAQYLLAPLRLRREIVEDFQDRLQKTVQQFVQSPYTMQLVLYDDQNAKTLKQQVDTIVEACNRANIRRGYAVLILPPSPKPGLHNIIKQKLNDRIQCQCVLADNLNAFYEVRFGGGKTRYAVKANEEHRYISYLRYTAFGHLIVNRKWLWALNAPLHYDVYIGVDVLHHTAAFTFLYEGGRRCFVHTYESKQKERLLPQQIYEIIYRHLKNDLTEYNMLPQSIIIHRDGRTYACEWRGFQKALQQLQQEGLLSSDLQSGIVEVHKQSALGLRLVLEKEGKLSNPQIGSWYPLGSREGIVCNTGTPFKLPGTVNPLHVQIAYGNLNLQYVLEDIFDLSQLCWMTPDRCCRLPITIKLADDFLRPVAAEADTDEAVYGEEESPEKDQEELVESA